MKLWKCSVCGFVYEGSEAPDSCPKCGAAKEKFSEMTSEDTKKIYSSDRTNDIHSEIISLCGKIIKLSEEGIKINLDPGCVSDFSKAKDSAWTSKQRSKAELSIHMKKGKW
ncbi:MAG: rubredoxin-like domain-containing protein [Clostridiales bacterium]